MYKENVSSSMSLCQPSCGYYFSSGFVISETIYSSASHGTFYNAASRIVIDGGRKVLHTAALGGMMAQNFTLPVYAGDSSGVQITEGQTSTVAAGETWTDTVLSGLPDNFAALSVSGTTVRTVISEYSSENVYVAGIDEYAVINGTQTISGSAFSATVSSHGKQYVKKGGIATSTIIKDGGIMAVSSGGKAYNVVQSQHGGLITYISGGDTSTYINGTYYGLDGTPVQNFLLENGVASGFLLDVNNSMYVYSGGLAQDTVLSNVLTEVVISGSSSAINSPGRMIIYNGGSAANTVINGGWISISSGGEATSTEINSRGAMWLNTGGYSISTVVNASGSHVLDSGALGGASALSTTINSLGSQYIKSGAIATSTFISKGGWQTISAGGSAIDTTVYSGGSQNIGYRWVSGKAVKSSSNAVSGKYSYMDESWVSTIDLGGSAINTIVSSGGNINVIVGGASNSAYLSAKNERGYSMTLSDNIASNFIVNSGGVHAVISGGITSDIELSRGGLLDVLSGGSVIKLRQYTGGRIYTYVYANGSGENTYIDGDYYGNYNGSDSATIQHFHLEDGIASHFTIDYNNSMWVASGGIASDTIVKGRLEIQSGGSSVDTVLNASGAFHSIRGGAFASNTTINAGGSSWVNAGASSYNTTVNSGGYHMIDQYGSAYDTEIFAGGYQWVSGAVISGSAYTGSAIRTTVHSGGVQDVAHQGFAASTIVENGGEQRIDSQGEALSTVVSAGGIQNIYASGIATSTTLNEGGKLILSSGGSATIVAQSSGADIKCDSERR